MSQSTFPRVAGFVFAVIAVAHIVRAVQAVPIQIGATSVPVWVSWIGAVVAGALSVWGLRSRG